MLAYNADMLNKIICNWIVNSKGINILEIKTTDDNYDYLLHLKCNWINKTVNRTIKLDIQYNTNLLYVDKITYISIDNITKMYSIDTITYNIKHEEGDDIIIRDVVSRAHNGNTPRGNLVDYTKLNYTKKGNNLVVTSVYKHICDNQTYVTETFICRDDKNGTISKVEKTIDNKIGDENCIYSRKLTASFDDDINDISVEAIYVANGEDKKTCMEELKLIKDMQTGIENVYAYENTFYGFNEDNTSVCKGTMISIVIYDEEHGVFTIKEATKRNSDIRYKDMYMLDKTKNDIVTHLIIRDDVSDLTMHLYNKETMEPIDGVRKIEIDGKAYLYSKCCGEDDDITPESIEFAVFRANDNIIDIAVRF